MGYDLYPLTCIEQRKRFLSRAIPEQWLVLFTHDHDRPMGYVEIGAKRQATANLHFSHCAGTSKSRRDG